MKKLVAIITIVFILLGVLSVTSAQAGSARRHTIEGVILGTGVAILSAAIINEINKDSGSDNNRVLYRQNDYYDRRPEYSERRYHKKRKHRYSYRPKGHWEYEKVWVAPIYEERWNPGHYNRRGRWISGRYQKFLVKEGYWSKKSVWVRH